MMEMIVSNILKSSMGTNTASFVTFIIYSLTAILYYKNLSGQFSFSKAKLRLVWLCGLCLHGYVLYRWIDTPFGQNLSLSHIFSFTCWLVIIATWFLSFSRIFDNLAILSLIITASSLPISIIFPGNNFFKTRQHPDLLIHIFISIMALGVLSMAALQAGLLYLQNRLLRHHANHSMIKILPPLQSMEALLFQILWFGFLLLSVSLIAAFIFLQDEIITHHIQKVVLTLLAWGIFAAILYEHYQSGLRGSKAIQWTLSGVGLLIIAYAGNKILQTGLGN